jgi:hypothetical protein
MILIALIDVGLVSRPKNDEARMSKDEAMKTPASPVFFIADALIAVNADWRAPRDLDWGAYACRVLVVASRDDELRSMGSLPTRETFAKTREGRAPQKIEPLPTARFGR